MYTTFGAPSGALGGSNGVQSGTESRISTLIVPLKGSPTTHLFRPSALAGFSASRSGGERFAQNRVLGIPPAG